MGGCGSKVGAVEGAEGSVGAAGREVPDRRGTYVEQDDRHSVPSSAGRATTENAVAVAVRVAATNVKAYLLHGINSDTEQFQPEIESQNAATCAALSHHTKKFIVTWLDDNLQSALREHLISRLSADGKSTQLAQSQAALSRIGESSFSSSTTEHDPAVPRGEDSDPTRLADLLPGVVANPNAPLNQTPRSPLSPTRRANTSQVTVPLVLQMPTFRPIDVVQTSEVPTLLRSPTATSVCESLPPMSLSRTIDIELLIKLVNSYCGAGRSGRQALDDAGLLGLDSRTTRDSFRNQRGKVVTLGDPIGALMRKGLSGEASDAPDSLVMVVPAYAELTYHLRCHDHAIVRTPVGSASSGSFVEPLSPRTPSVQSSGASFMDHSFAARESGGSTGDLEDGSIGSGVGALSNAQQQQQQQQMERSSSSEWLLSPYAGHGSPWKERILTTETMVLHNKLLLMQEKEKERERERTSESKEAKKMREAAERRPKVLMQLLFGPPILQTYWSRK